MADNRIASIGLGHRSRPRNGATFECARCHRPTPVTSAHLTRDRQTLERIRTCRAVACKGAV